MSLLRQSPSGGPAHSPSSDQSGIVADWPVTSPASSSNSSNSSSSRLVVHSPASTAQGPLSLNSMQIALMALKVRVARTVRKFLQSASVPHPSVISTDPDLQIHNELRIWMRQTNLVRIRILPRHFFSH